MRPAGGCCRRGGGLLVLGLALSLSAALLLRGCAGQQAEDDGSADAPAAAAAAATAPMEEKERRALYAAIESFVGKGWNGSGLYPDPCGWSPIQVRPCLPACAFPFASIYAAVLFDFLARVCSSSCSSDTREKLFSLFVFSALPVLVTDPFSVLPCSPALSSNPKPFAKAGSSL
jgi:hypothetical protein